MKFVSTTSPTPAPEPKGAEPRRTQAKSQSRRVSLPARAGILAAVLLSVARGQYVEKTVYLPDSLCGVVDPRCVAFADGVGKAYVGGKYDRCIVAIDADSSRLVARIPTGQDVRDVCFNPTNRKVYTADRRSGTVTVIDAVMDSVLVRLSVPATLLCYSSASNKVYCSAPDAPSGTVTVIDGVTDRVVAELSVGMELSALCYSQSGNKVYVADERTDEGRVYVIDCSSDSITAQVTVGAGATALVYDTRANEVYCAAKYANTVTVIDALSDSVVARVAVGDEPLALCYNPRMGRVYCACLASNSVVAIDCASRRVVGVIVQTNPSVVGCDTVRNRLYSINHGFGTLDVIDCSTNAVVRSVPSWSLEHALAVDHASGRVYCVNNRTDDVTVYDAAADSVAAVVPVGGMPLKFALNPSADKVYVMLGSGRVCVLDGATNRVLNTVDFGRDGRDICYNTVQNKLYAADYGGGSAFVTVIDGWTDSVLRTVRVGQGLVDLSYNPLRSKVYTAECIDNRYSVIDGATDQVVAIVPNPGGWSAMTVYYAAASDRVYASDNEVLTVIDGTGDSVRGNIPISSCFSLCASERSRKLYCGDNDLMSVCYDGDTVISETVPGLQHTGIHAMAHDPVHDRMYFTATYSSEPTHVGVIDCARDSLLAVFYVGWQVWDLCYEPETQLIFGCYHDSVWVLDTRTLSEVARFPAARDAGALLLNPRHGRIYVSDCLASRVLVIRSGAGGLAAAPGERRRKDGCPTIIASSGRVRTNVPCAVFDASGRRVARLLQGQSTRLPAGVYYQTSSSVPRRKLVVAE